MPSLRSIRGRIKSVKNTRQITKAMEMVASAKMRKAQMRVRETRPYAEKIKELMVRLSAIESHRPNLFFNARPVTTIGIILVSTDRGLCGPINFNVFRQVNRFMAERPGVRFEFVVVGKKGQDFVRRSSLKAVGAISGVKDRGQIEEILPATNVALDEFKNGRWDEVWLFYTEFVSTLSQKPKMEKILPIGPDIAENAPMSASPFLGEYLYEPDTQDILDVLIPRYFESVVFQRIMENFASEYSARMMAMRNATSNAKEVIYQMTLIYNKLRQAAITREISEIASGADAVKQG
ncbi:MAG: ATP synthase F1 subunit gamma [Nitrospirota bacterium]|nr:ATP synthase F1 subunit gamma [Nitrospirota bacterium]